ncbi:hypothetical protein [Nitrosospira sp. Nsp1]|uniref:hypothetical protein n=1 Tax=Nitrosospira sp. Nsp1 TaxID=136547 RepID=UPI000B83C672|nr:hypothetical protein [Nitrosospira sp. Nsp1]
MTIELFTQHAGARTFYTFSGRAKFNAATWLNLLLTYSLGEGIKASTAYKDKETVCYLNIAGFLDFPPQTEILNLAECSRLLAMKH